MEDSRSGTNGRTDTEQKVKVSWLHPQEACQQHHQAGFDLGSTGEEKEGRTWRTDTEVRMQRSGHSCKSLEKTAQSPVCWRSVVDGL